MIFLLDQDVPDAIARIIQEAGHEASHLREHLPIESTDDHVLTSARTRGAILVTCNRDDFLTLAKTTPHAGESGLRNNINFA